MTDEEREICKRLHKDPEEVFIARDGSALYALVNGDFLKFAGAEFNKMTGRKLIEFMIDAIEAGTAIELEHTRAERTM